MRALRTTLAILMAGLIGLWGWASLSTLGRYGAIIRDVVEEKGADPLIGWLILTSTVFSGVFALVASWRLVASKPGAAWFWGVAVLAWLSPWIVGVAIRLAKGWRIGEFSTSSWITLGVCSAVGLLILFIERRELRA